MFRSLKSLFIKTSNNNSSVNNPHLKTFKLWSRQDSASRNSQTRSSFNLSSTFQISSQCRWEEALTIHLLILLITSFYGNNRLSTLNSRSWTTIAVFLYIQVKSINYSSSGYNPNLNYSLNNNLLSPFHSSSQSTNQNRRCKNESLLKINQILPALRNKKKFWGWLIEESLRKNSKSKSGL